MDELVGVRKERDELVGEKDHCMGHKLRPASRREGQNRRGERELVHAVLQSE